MRRKLEEFSTVIMIFGLALAGLTWLTASEAVKMAMPFLVFAGIGLTIAGGLVYAIRFVIFQSLSSRKEVAELSRDTSLARDEKTRSGMYLNAESAMLNEQLNLMRSGLISLKTVGGDATHFEQFKKALLPDIVEEPLLNPLPLLPAIANRQRLLIVGASDSGKTTLMRHLIDVRENVLMIDPHGTPPKWGEIKHVGQGRDYRGIGAMLNLLVAEMTKRYEQLGTGEVIEGQHTSITVFVDEWRAIIKNCDEAGQCLTTLLTEGRKASMSLVIASHSIRVQALGIQGEGDLRKGFSVVNLYGGNGEERYATLSTNGSDEVTHTLPGAYMDSGFTDQLTIDALSILSLDVMPNVDQQVIDEYLKTGSYSAAFRALYKLENGKDYDKAIGGNQTSRIKAILDEHGIEHPVSK